MTGLAARDDFLFLSTENLPLFLSCAYRFHMPDLTGITAYRTYSGGYTVTRDITLDAEGNVWVAADHATHSARLYNAAHQMADYIPTALIPHASGTAMCPDGFLWMADPVNDLIYKVDLEVGLQGSLHAAVPEFTVSIGANPFFGSVALFVEGTPAFEVEVFDVYGRKVAQGSAGGFWVWDGMYRGRPAPSGAYLALVKAENGAVASVTLLRI